MRRPMLARRALMDGQHQRQVTASPGLALRAGRPPVILIAAFLSLPVPQ